MIREASRSADLTTDNGNAFEHEAGMVLDQLRPALAAVLESFDPPITRATDLRRRVELDQRLSWSIFNAAMSKDRRTLASLLPGRRSMWKFLDVCVSKGVPSEVANRVREAFERFEEAVERHAGRRDAFEAMVGDLEGESEVSEAAAIKQRRTLFQASSLLWGTQLRTHVTLSILHPSADPGLTDHIAITGKIGFRQTRREVTLHSIVGMQCGASADQPIQALRFEPLDPRESGERSVGLLWDFCSQPLPEFKTVADTDRELLYELVGRGLGAAGETTCYTGHILRKLSLLPNKEGMETGASTTFHNPTALHIRDMFMHESIWDTKAPEIEVYAQSSQGNGNFSPADRLPFTFTATPLGKGVEAARTPEIPRYTELLNYAMDRMGWKASEFRVFRCRVEYPLLYTRIRMVFKK